MFWFFFYNFVKFQKYKKNFKLWTFKIPVAKGCLFIFWLSHGKHVFFHNLYVIKNILKMNRAFKMSFINVFSFKIIHSYNQYEKYSHPTIVRWNWSYWTLTTTCVHQLIRAIIAQEIKSTSRCHHFYEFSRYMYECAPTGSSNNDFFL